MVYSWKKRVERIRIYSLLFTVVLWIILGLIVTILLIWSVFCNGENESVTEEDFKVYKYFRYDPNNDEVSRGTVKFPDLLDETEKSFVNYPTGEQILISDLESTGYKCTGTCFCEEEMSRKSSLPLVRSITYIVAAMSSILALQKAQNIFRKECQERISTESCPQNAIQATVEDCDYPFFQQGTLFTFGTEGIHKDHITERDFECTGNCLPIKMNKQLTKITSPNEDCDPIYEINKIQIDDPESTRSDCNSLYFTATVTFRTPDDYWIDYSGVPFKSYVDQARIEFMFDFLQPYCFTTSTFFLPDNNNNNKKQKSSKCKGYDQICGENFSNPTVECKPVVSYKGKHMAHKPSEEEFWSPDGIKGDEFWGKDDE